MASNSNETFKWRIETCSEFIDLIHCQTAPQDEIFLAYNLIDRCFSTSTKIDEIERTSGLICPKCKELVPKHILTQVKVLSC